MSEEKIEVCPRCSVTIENGSKVVFSVGAPGTRARLYARVCEFALKQDREAIANGEEPKGGCINADPTKLTITEKDYYGNL